MSGGGAPEGVGAGVVAQAVGVAIEVKHDRAVQEAVEHGGGDGGVAPGPDAAVGGQDDRGFGVALGDDLEQGGCCLGG